MKTVEKLRVAPPNALVIEDSVNGVRSGKAAGCRVIAITTSFPLSSSRSNAGRACLRWNPLLSRNSAFRPSASGLAREPLQRGFEAERYARPLTRKFNGSSQPLQNMKSATTLTPSQRRGDRPVRRSCRVVCSAQEALFLSTLPFYHTTAEPYQRQEADHKSDQRPQDQ